jgi:hypothetical protein
LSVSAVLYPRLFLVMVAILDTGRRWRTLLTYITGFLKNFELLLILTDYAN